MATTSSPYPSTWPNPSRILATSALVLSGLALAFGAGFTTATLRSDAVRTAQAPAPSGTQLGERLAAHAAQERAEMIAPASFVDQVVAHSARERADMATSTSWEGFVRHAATERADMATSPVWEGFVRHAAVERAESGH